ncbi:hypothetical protein KY284_025640 [Solanum tuberosum]|nr:hypothetical protein KY284_025640 [Solanum tuberosum]
MALPRSNEETIHLSLVNAASFVSIKLCGESNYIPWKTQIVCLLQSHDLLKFVDGTIQEDEEEKGDEEDYNLQRKRNDELVKACIFGSLSDQLLKDKAVHELDTARQVWLVLEQRYSPKPKLQGGSRVVYIELKDYSFYFPLFRALLSRDWEKAEAFLKQEKDASIAPINTQLQTALHLAVGVKSEKGNKHFVEKLVASIENKEDLARKDCFGETALHYAARFGNLDAAEIIVKRNPRLPHIACMYGTYPIHYAASYGYVSVDVFAYFLRVTEDPAPYTNLSGVKLLYALVSSDLYDFATELVEEFPNLAKYEECGNSALKNLTKKEFTFLGTSRLNFWQQLLYYCVPIKLTSRSLQRRPNANDVENIVNDSQMVKTKYERIYFSIVIKKLHTLLFDVLEILVPHLKHVRDKKSIHHNAVKYAACLCEKIANLNYNEVDSIAGNSLLDAACYDNYELVDLILRRFPYLVYYNDHNQKNILHITVENRSKNVFKLVCQMSPLLHNLVICFDSSSNTILDLAGKLAPQNKLNLVSGPAFQMQQELQWFKEVKQIVPSTFWKRLNLEMKDPYVVFTEEHEKLKVDGEKWMKDTSSSCTIAAALIATIAFAAAITVPGGNNQQSGLPIFSANIGFIIFAISNAASLFTSSTSLLVFLSVLTSRYAEEDFLHTLPRSLILGLLTLFLSITSMIISFSATVYIMYGQKKAWVLLPVATMACLPITSFVLLQFPLLVALISSTYGAGIFRN